MSCIVNVLIWVLLIKVAVSWIPNSRRVSHRERWSSLLQEASNNDNKDDTTYLWQSHISTHPSPKSALLKVLDDLPTQQKPDIAFLFVNQAFASEFMELVQLAASHFGTSTQLVSLVGGGVIGDGRELDNTQLGISILAGTLPEGANVEILCSTNPSKTSDDVLFDDDNADYLLFADPWSNVEALLTSLPDTSVCAGGISCPTTKESTIAHQNLLLPVGSAVTVKLTGSIGLQTVVAQGCRPIGQESLTITELYKDQIITKLNDKPALEVLEQVTNNASPSDHALIETGLLCGIAASPSEGDYLSRQLAGFVPAIGGIVVGTSNLKVGDKFCFQVRDGTIAQKDLKWMVDRAKAARLVTGQGKPLAALQISCVARGRGMFDGIPNVDMSQLKELLPTNSSNAIGGFFANGEIGPVGITQSGSKGIPSHVHGFTTVVAVFYDKSKSAAGMTEGSSSSSSSDFEDAWG